jgi:HAD superfamily hydrolase (TIGR01509 family)
MMRAGLTNLLFDLDGTLVDSAPLHARAFRDVLAVEDDAALRHFDYEPLKGLTTREAFGKLGILDEPRLSRCAAAKQQRYRALVRDGALSLLPGARSVLERAAKEEYRSFLVTSGSRESVRMALDTLGIADLFVGVVTSEDVARGKPAPDLYLFCLRSYALDAAASIAIEDARSGVISAQEAGLSVVGVGNPSIAALVSWYFPDLNAFAAALLDTPRTAATR